MANEVTYKADKAYQISLLLDGAEDDTIIKSEDILGISIISSISVPYQTVIIDFNIHPKDAVLSKIYGQNPIKLNIGLKTEDGQELESIEFDLIFTNIAFNVPVMDASEHDQDLLAIPVRVATVTRMPFQIMSSLVNKIYGAIDDKKTPRDIITDLHSLIQTNIQNVPDISYDTASENLDLIDQVVIPPMTFNKACKYINNTFGLHDGASIVVCNYDGTVYVRNMSDIVQNNRCDVTITQLVKSRNSDENTSIIEKSLSGTDYYTYDNITSNNVSNSKFAYQGKTINFITKPKDDLFGLVEIDLETICNSYGLTDGEGIYYDSGLDRTRYVIEHTGYESSQTFANCFMARRMSNMTTMDFSLERNIMIENLLLVGSGIKLNIPSEVSDLSGNYALGSSEIKLSRFQSGYQATAKVRLIKTNKT